MSHRADYGNAPVPGALRIAVELDSNWLAGAQKRDVALGNRDMQQGRGEIEHLRESSSRVEMQARNILQVGSDHDAVDGRAQLRIFDASAGASHFGAKKIGLRTTMGSPPSAVSKAVMH